MMFGSCRWYQRRGTTPPKRYDPVLPSPFLVLLLGLGWYLALGTTLVRPWHLGLMVPTDPYTPVGGGGRYHPKEGTGEAPKITTTPTARPAARRHIRRVTFTRRVIGGHMLTKRTALAGYLLVLACALLLLLHG
jgi:hypothetical protein